MQKECGELISSDSTRRDFLKNAGVLAVGLAFLGGMTSAEVQKVQSDSIHEGELEKVYTDGDVIQTSVSPIIIDGWHILINNKNLQNYNESLVTYQHAEYGFGEVNDRALFQILNFTYQGQPVWVNSNLSGSAMTLETGFEGSIFDQHPGPLYSIAATPEQTRYLCLIEPAFEGEKAKTTIYPIEMKDYGNGETVFCEKPIPNDQFKEIERIQDSFAWLSNTSPKIYLHRGMKNERNGQYILEESAIYATLDHFLKPLYQNEGQMVVFHECAHHLIQSSRQMPNPEIMTTADDMERTRLLLRLFEAHKRYVELAGIKYPIPQDLLLPQDKRLETSSLLGILDESSYVQRKKNFDGGGHPYDNYSELFASTLSVMRFFPNQMISSYNHLSEREKAVIKDIVITTIDFIELKQRAKDVKRLIPKILEIKDILT